MKDKGFWRPVYVVAFLIFATSIGALAQNPANRELDRVKEFRGQINGYSPQNAKGGPYVICGPWSLQLKRPAGKADFYAAVDMELSDGWVLTRNGGNFDPTTRDAHTHHITMSDADVTPIPNGFQVTGTATITLNGGQAPISPSPLTIEITGSTEVEFSNITLTFGSPGSNHFGMAPVTGVVRTVREHWSR